MIYALGKNLFFAGRAYIKKQPINKSAPRDMDSIVVLQRCKYYKNDTESNVEDFHCS